MGQGAGRAHRLTGAERLELQLRVRAGETHAVAATALGCSAKSVQRLLVKTGGIKPRSTPQSALRLSLPEREEISRGLLAGDSCRVIARRLGRAPSTVSRDVAAAGPDRLGVAGITYIPTWAGFLYLAVLVCAWSRRVIGWAMEA